MSLEILVGLPVTRPARVNQYRFSAHIQRCETGFVNSASVLRRDAYQHTVQRGKLFESQLRQVVPIGVTMERRVDVRASVRDHLDLADLELRLLLIDSVGCF